MDQLKNEIKEVIISSLQLEDIKPENRQDFNGTAMDLENLIENQNYSYCQRCFN